VISIKKKAKVEFLKVGSILNSMTVAKLFSINDSSIKSEINLVIFTR
jgi:hypothetical protein